MMMDAGELAAYLPDRLDCAVVFPLSFLLALAMARAAAWLKAGRRWKTNYSRKAFHVAMFTAAFGLGYTSTGVFAGATGAALCAALAEALSPHGWDNLTTQLAACLGAFVAVTAVAPG